MSDLSITYIGHATSLIRIGGLNILTDSNYNRRDFIFPRVIPPGFAFEQFPPIDVAVFPIGPVRYRPFLRGVHMNGFDVLKAFQGLGVRYLLPY